MGCASSKPDAADAQAAGNAGTKQSGTSPAPAAAASPPQAKQAAGSVASTTGGSDGTAALGSAAEVGPDKGVVNLHTPEALGRQPAAAPPPAPAASESAKDQQQHARADANGTSPAAVAPPHDAQAAPQPTNGAASPAAAAAAAPAAAAAQQPQEASASPDDALPSASAPGAGSGGSSDGATSAAQQDVGPPTGLTSATSSGTAAGLPPGMGTWDKAKMLFTLMRADELLNDLHDLKYIGAGGYGKVFKAVWRSATVAVKLVPSHSPELAKSSSYKEALLCKELCHPNIVQTYETRCAQLTEEFVHSILAATTPPGQTNSGLHMSGNGNTTSYGSQEFVSGDGFGLPSPVPDMIVRGKTLPEAAAKWKDILFTTGAKAGDYLTVIIMDFCDYGSLVRPIVKGMFRPFSASGSDREARVRYRALLRTAKEIAQGLEHLHYLRVVHGDLKPGNVLLKGSRVDVRGFNAQVIDFGLSHMVNNSNPQRVSKAGGTLVYAAPEVFSGVVGKAADVYSLGIILWEMVTGSQPYKDLNEGQIVIGVQKQGLRPAWPPGQLPQLQELYERCVAHDPEARPKAKEVVQFLTQIEMDLRSELRAAHKRQQQAQQQPPAPAPAPAAAGGAAANGADQAQLLAAHQQAMAALQQQQAPQVR